MDHIWRRGKSLRTSPSACFGPTVSSAPLAFEVAEPTTDSLHAMSISPGSRSCGVLSLRWTCAVIS